jgi:hypothetical protein
VFELVNPIKIPLTSDAATSDGVSQITLNARVDPAGKPTTVYFQYGTTATYGEITPPVNIGSGLAAVPVSAVITGLLPNTSYHYRVVAKCGATTEVSPDQLLETNNAGPLLAANDDTAFEGGTSPIVINVLANDTTPSYLSANAFVMNPPLHGRVTMSWDATLITYTPSFSFANYAGTDSFTYSLDGLAPATVTISNPYFTEAGQFSGALNAPANGMLTLTVARTGAFTGRLRIGTATHVLSGRFDDRGVYSATIAGQPLTLQFPNPLPSGSSLSLSMITGTYGGTPVVAMHAAGFSPAAPAPEFGRYTMLLPTNPSVAGSPVGAGFAVLTVTQKGAVTITGHLADGTAFSEATFLTAGGTSGVDIFTLFVKLGYKIPGLLSGTLTFESVPGQSDFDGMLAWTKPIQAHDTLYPLGISTSLPAIGARYFAPARVYLALDLSAIGSLMAEIDVSGPTLMTPLSKNAKISIDFESAAVDTVSIINVGQDYLYVTINRATGVITGSFRPTRRTESIIHGVILQPQERAEGFFTYNGQSGEVKVAPMP